MAKFPDPIEVEVINWEKFNPRKDLKATTWFRLQNSLLEDPDYFSFSHSELVAWIYILSQCSKKQRGVIRLNYEHAFRTARLGAKEIDSALEKLVILSAVRARHADDTRTSHYERTNERDETNETERDETPQPAVAGPVFDFESIYQEYPRKIGRDEGIKRARQTIRTPEDFEGLRKATRNYADYCREMKTEERYILHFSTFIEKRDSKPYTRPWRDYIERKNPASPDAYVGIAALLGKEKSA